MVGWADSVGGSLGLDLPIMDWKDESGRREEGDSGDELGDGSVTEGESKVDIVVVGEEFVESELTEMELWRC